MVHSERWRVQSKHISVVIEICDWRERVKISERVGLDVMWTQYPASKTSDQWKAVHQCPVRPSLARGLCQPCPVDGDKYADIQQMLPRLGICHKEGGGSVLLSCPGNQDNLACEQVNLTSFHGGPNFHSLPLHRLNIKYWS